MVQYNIIEYTMMYYKTRRNDIIQNTIVQYNVMYCDTKPQYNMIPYNINELHVT